MENTLHDLRWGDWDRSSSAKDYVWVFEISGAAPPAHFTGGWRGAEGFRQPPMYFPKGGSTLRGISKAGEIIWSRIFVTPEGLNMDLGRGWAVKCPLSETERRWQSTTWQWPIMHGVTYGVTRDQFMARHKANHLQVVYAHSPAEADECLIAKAAMAEALGMKVSICGRRKSGLSLGLINLCVAGFSRCFIVSPFAERGNRAAFCDAVLLLQILQIGGDAVA